MTNIDPKKREEFLRELTVLSHEYGIVIGGCGCCGSPHLTEQPMGVGDKYITGEKYSLYGPDDDLKWVGLND